MNELVIQNYNHPSIICWALSNEITATGGVTEDMVENHKVLNDLCHRLDATRPTATAHAFMLGTGEEFVTLTDIRSYNLYYGWYMGEMEENDEWFDRYHAEHPDQVIGLSEYGADANPQYQTAAPEKGDYTETYQALYHEHMLAMWKERPFIWAMHVWNMFDFGADGREEGGKPGQNQKGLVTFDRKTKKDAFYIYKAYLSGEPFVHLCGSRYIDRAEEETEIKVYACALSREMLKADGQSLCFAQVDVVDEEGNLIPYAEAEISAKVEGVASLAVFGTGRPVTEENYTAGKAVSYHGKALAVIRSGYQAGVAKLIVSADGLESAELEISVTSCDRKGMCPCTIL